MDEDFRLKEAVSMSSRNNDSVSPEGSNIKVGNGRHQHSTPEGRRLCSRACNCACHPVMRLRSPSGMRHVIGLPFFEYSGLSALFQKCKERKCWRRQHKEVRVSYFMPPWLLFRAVGAAVRWGFMRRPKLSLRVMRVVPDEAPVFAYARQGNILGMQALFEQGAASPIDVAYSDGRSVAHIAIYAGRQDMARFLTDNGTDYRHEDKFANSITDACWEMMFQGILSISPFALGESTEETDFLDRRNFSILHKIVLGISGMKLSTQLDLQAVDIDVHDISGRSALQWAASRGDAEAVETLIRYGADPNDFSDAHWTSLHQAALSANPIRLELLLRGGARVDERTGRGDTAMSIAALVQDDSAYMESLYAYGADVNFVNDRGETPLHRAVLRDKALGVQWLLNHGSEIESTDSLDRTSFHLSVINSSRRSMSILLDRGCRTSMSARFGRTPLHDAAALAHVDVLWALAAADLDAQEIDSLDDAAMNIEDIFNKERHLQMQEDEKEHLDAMRALEAILIRLRRPPHQV